MRLLPHKHILQYDWLVHFHSIMSLFFPALFLVSSSEANPWQLLLLYPLFLLYWYRSFWQTGKSIYVYFFLLLVLASWAAYLHWSGAFLFFYGQILLLQLPRLWQASLGLFIEVALLILFAWWQEYPAIFIISFAALIIFGGHANYLFFRHINAQRELIVTQEKLEYVLRTRERERIARDLHDVLGHTLSSIALKSELAEKYLQKNMLDNARAELAEISDSARAALADVRQTVTGYRAGNLRSELAMAKNSLSAAGFTIEFPSTLPKGIGRELENVLSLIVREAVTNIIRHAQASRCRIQLFSQDDNWCLVVSDDGVGWSGLMGNGLSGMKERVSFLSGHLKIENQKPGTKLIVSLPKQALEDLDG